MAKIGWGKPKVEFTPLVNGEVPENATFDKMPEIKQDTAKLTTTKGDKKEAIAEGGDVIDIRYAKSKYAFECEVFVQAGAKAPIEDNDGLVASNYAVRLTPEDPANEGFRMDNCKVTVETTFTSAEGKTLKYTFDGIKPAKGSIIKPYKETASGSGSETPANNA